MYNTKQLFDINHTLAKPYFENEDCPWKIIPEIKNIVLQTINKLDKKDYIQKEENVWIHKTAKIFNSAYINGPCIIGANTEIRHCAFIRGSALIGENCVIGNSVEVKNAIIFDNVQVPHYNYVGDSILGYKSHMGAGSITSNLRSDKKEIKIKFQEENINTGFNKMGAILGDFVEVGCNAVLNPGTIVGRNSSIYPTSCVIGVVEENTILTNTNKKIKKV